MINNFKIYGERCSGTNYIKELMLTNFDLVDLCYDFDYKHFFGFHKYKHSKLENETLFIGIIRHPIAWINSLSKDLWHIPKENKNIEDMISKEFYSVNFINSEGQIFYNDSDNLQEILLNDINFKNNKRYKDIFELRKVKNEFLLHDMYNLVKNYFFVKYEDLQDDPCKILLQISKKFNISLKHDIQNISYYKNKKEQKYVPRGIDLCPNIVEKIISKSDMNQEFGELNYDMRMTYTVYGNCQASVLAFILNNTQFTQMYKYIEIKPVHEMTLKEIQYLNKNVFPYLNLFIFLPIINFEKDFTTNYILEHVLNKNTIVIYFQTIYFTTYFPQIKKIKNYSNIEIPIDYHDINLLNNFTQGMNNFDYDLYTDEYLKNNLEKNINSLIEREDFMYKNARINKYIPISNFIKENYNKKLLLYTIDHGSKYIYDYIISEILRYFGIKYIPLNIDPQNKIKLPIYKSVAKFCNIDPIDSTEKFTSDIKIYKDILKINKKIKVFTNQKYLDNINENDPELIVYLSKELDMKLLHKAMEYKYNHINIPIIGIFVNSWIKIKNGFFDLCYTINQDYEIKLNIPLLINQDIKLSNSRLMLDTYMLLKNNEIIVSQMENIFLNNTNTKYKFGILESLNKTTLQNIQYFLLNEN